MQIFRIPKTAIKFRDGNNSEYNANNYVCLNIYLKLVIFK